MGEVRPGTVDNTSTVNTIDSNTDQLEGFHTVPTQNSSSNSVIRDVIGNKTDTSAGNSVISLSKAVKAVTDNLPDSGALTSISSAITTIDNMFDISTQNSSANIIIRDVVGNKTDTSAGTNIISLSKAIKAVTDNLPDSGALTSISSSITTVDGFFDVATKNSSTNLTIRDVIGNKTDDEDGDSIYSVLYTLEKHFHSACSVYPTLANEVVINKANSSAWGLDAASTEIVPATTGITLPFDIHFINIGTISNLDEYELILYSGTSPLVEIARISFDRAATQTEGACPCQTAILPGGTRISAKLTSRATAARNISLKLFYHTY